MSTLFSFVKSTLPKRAEEGKKWGRRKGGSIQDFVKRDDSEKWRKKVAGREQWKIIITKAVQQYKNHLDLTPL